MITQNSQPGKPENDTGAVDLREHPLAGGSASALDILHLAELIPVIRQRFGLDDTYPDDAVLASLRSIAAHSGSRERWQAAFRSNLGHWLGQRGTDLNTSLNTLVGLLPRPTS